MKALFLVAQLAPIYLQPGQCILVGSQQVCAIKPDAPAATDVAPKPTVMNLCRYGEMENPDTPNGKGWSHVRTIVKDDGTKTETIIKSYGPLDEHKRECEADVRRAAR